MRGHVAHDQGDQERALALYAESLTLYKRVGDRVGIAACLEGLSCVAFAQGQMERATRLSGAAAALRDEIGAPLPPADRPAYERAVAALHTALGDDAFEAYWEAGRALSLEQAIAEALAPGEPSPDASPADSAAGCDPVP
jgi:tetratricopeptide (TPR) repeat protein